MSSKLHGILGNICVCLVGKQDALGAEQIYMNELAIGHSAWVGGIEMLGGMMNERSDLMRKAQLINRSKKNPESWQKPDATISGSLSDLDCVKSLKILITFCREQANELKTRIELGLMID